MDRIFVSDKTMKQSGRQLSLSFREKIELSRLIDRVGVDWIELPLLTGKKADMLLTKSIASAVKNAGISIQVGLNAQSVEETWNAVKEASKTRLQVEVPVSSVQMEYLFHIKPEAMIQLVSETIRECLRFTERVEFIAGDATRGDAEFVIKICRAAVEAGACQITFHETAGEMMPEELLPLIGHYIEKIGCHEGLLFGIDCSNDLSMADACAIESIRKGVREIKAASFCINCVSLPHIVQILHLKGARFGVQSHLRKEEIKRITLQIDSLCRSNVESRDSLLSEEQIIPSGDVALTVHDSRESVFQSAVSLGYDLSSEDQEKVYKAFLNVAEKKENVTLRELDAIIAAEAMQVPSVCSIISYTVNSSNLSGSVAHLRLKLNDAEVQGVAVGDGPIDAAIHAIEQATGKHYEMDGFRVQAMTEGRETTGETVIHLRSEGKLYSGRGISTDIIGASILSYLNALNKIIFEEEEEE